MPLSTSSANTVRSIGSLLLAVVFTVGDKPAGAEEQRAAVAAAPVSARAVEESARRLVRPGTGAVSSPYGMRSHPVTGVHKLHTGVDFQFADGRAYAAAAGTVTDVAVDAAYGNLVTIAHSDRTATRYAHLAAVLVETGDSVSAGQVIGRIGSTGLATGPHLHFELLVNGEFEDPSRWLGR